MKIQLQLLSYCKHWSSNKIISRQNINIGIRSGAAMEEAIEKDQSICIRKKKVIARHIDARSVVWTLIYNGKLANQIVRLVAIVVKVITIILLTSFSRSATHHMFSTLSYDPSLKHDGHELKWKKKGTLTFSTDWQNKVRFSLYLLEIELSWKAHYKVKQFILSENMDR